LPGLSGTAGARTGRTRPAEMSPVPCRRRASTKTSEPLEDAPPGHIAWEKMNCNDKIIQFTFHKGSGKRMQLNIRTCNNSREDAERICRLCYIQFQEGRSKKEVMEYRNRLLEQRGYAVPVPIGDRKRKAEEAAQEEHPEDDASDPEDRAERPGDEEVATAADSAPSPAPSPKATKAASASGVPAEPAAKSPAGKAAKKANQDAAQADSPSAKSAANRAANGPSAAQAAAKTSGTAAAAKGAASATPSAAASAPAPPLHDAPEGHPAHDKVKTEGQEAVFDYVLPDSSTVVFRTSASTCSKSVDEAKRIGRLCYMKFEEGMSESEVRYFRNCLLSGCSFMMAPPRRPSATDTVSIPAAASAAAAGTASEESPSAAKGRKRRLDASPAACPALPDAKAGEPGTCSSPASASTSSWRNPAEARGDAPEGHVAHRKVKPANKGTVASFEYITPQGKVPFQTTVRACGGSLAEAKRICRLCYLKFEEGLPKEKVLSYRSWLYAQRSSGSLSGCLRAKRGAGVKVPAPVQTEDAPEGHQAHRWCRASPDGKVVSFDRMFTKGGPYVCFQTTTNRCSGSVKEALRICRLCFLKFEAGWTKDEVLRFREQEYRKSGLRRLCRGAFFKLGASHRLSGLRATSPAGAGTEEASAAAAATPQSPQPRRGEHETPEKPEKRGKRCGGEPSPADKPRADSGDAAEADPATGSTSAVATPVAGEVYGAVERPEERRAVAMPWPALHGAESVAGAEQGARHNQRDGMKGLAHQLRSLDTAAQTALHKRFCSRRRLPGRKPAGCIALGPQVQPGVESGGRDAMLGTAEVLLELEHTIAPVTGAIMNDLLRECGESLVFADILASQAPNVAGLWREIPVDEVR